MIDDVSGDLSFISVPDPEAPTDANSDGIYEVIVAVCDSHCESACDEQILYIDINQGQLCIDAPLSLVFSGSFASENVAQIVEQQLSDYFTVMDTISAFS